MDNLAAEKQSDNPLGLSDDDFMNNFHNHLEAAQSEETSPVEDKPAEQTPSEETKPEPKQEEETKPVEKVEEVEVPSTGSKQKVTGKVEENGDNKQVDKPVNTEVETDKAPSKTATEATAKDKQPTEQKAPQTEIDHKAFYDLVMKPFKANGKTIEVRTPEEAIQLMQQGANYTRKMQDFAPYRKTVMMLENNGLLDDAKLSYLIDLHNKNPDAIKKLIKESGMDPMDIDPNEQVNYQQGNHSVTDEEANFRTQLDDIKSTPEGVQTLQTINTDFDQASKEYLFNNPDIMPLIHQQRENGIYDLITTELNRQRALGQIPANVSFLQAYKVIGDALQKQGVFNDIVNPAGSKAAEVPVKEPVKPIETKVAAPKPQVSNDDKAKAATASRATSTQKATSKVNPLAMSDADFMKQFENRL